MFLLSCSQSADQRVPQPGAQPAAVAAGVAGSGWEAQRGGSARVPGAARAAPLAVRAGPAARRRRQAARRRRPAHAAAHDRADGAAHAAATQSGMSRDFVLQLKKLLPLRRL